ncbi:hypothetical protein PYCCODRAFT_532900 [Trametes coccinea BRFM310]|uniref:Uncharacterized protein n=1 Tax=Trametes coccinea (strain BRFM310) TaxID=1353009 RepID=A0A1Y2IJE2_TRAC3|nr:hypothetical protein PYCCODRAFT_532900 [Trametes coccinea BRFM310]
MGWRAARSFVHVWIVCGARALWELCVYYCRPGAFLFFGGPLLIYWAPVSPTLSCASSSACVRFCSAERRLFDVSGAHPSDTGILYIRSMQPSPSMSRKPQEDAVSLEPASGKAYDPACDPEAHAYVSTVQRIRKLSGR